MIWFFVILLILYGGFISVADNSDRGPSGGDDYVLAATGGNGSVQLINLNA